VRAFPLRAGQVSVAFAWLRGRPRPAGGLDFQIGVAGPDNAGFVGEDDDLDAVAEVELADWPAIQEQLAQAAPASVPA